MSRIRHVLCHTNTFTNHLKLYQFLADFIICFNKRNTLLQLKWHWDHIWLKKMLLTFQLISMNYVIFFAPLQHLFLSQQFCRLLNRCSLLRETSRLLGSSHIFYLANTSKNIPNMEYHVLPRILGMEERLFFLNFLSYFKETM